MHSYYTRTQKWSIRTRTYGSTLTIPMARAAQGNTRSQQPLLAPTHSQEAEETTHMVTATIETTIVVLSCSVPKLTTTVMSQ